MVPLRFLDSGHALTQSPPPTAIATGLCIHGPAATVHSCVHSAVPRVGHAAQGAGLLWRLLYSAAASGAATASTVATIFSCHSRSGCAPGSLSGTGTSGRWGVFGRVQQPLLLPAAATAAAAAGATVKWFAIIPGQAAPRGRCLGRARLGGRACQVGCLAATAAAAPPAAPAACLALWCRAGGCQAAPAARCVPAAGTPGWGCPARAGSPGGPAA